jgi:uncharacterized OB-fold protein
MDLVPEAAGETGTVYSFTIVRTPFGPGLEVPYLLALVELDEAKGFRLLGNIVRCADEDAFIGMSVKVTYEEINGGEMLAPMFEPRDSSTPDRSGTAS